MNAVFALRRDLAERRLVPVVVALALSVVAIPAFLLKTGPMPTPTKPAASAAAGAASPKVVVRQASDATLNNGDRHLIGKPKDIFKP